MAVKSTATLKTELDANIAANGSNAVTGAILNTFLNDFLDSVVNTTTDSNDLATNAYKSGDKDLTNTTNIQITFNTDMGTANYKVYFTDKSGVLVTATAPHDILSTGFQVDGSGVGTIEWLAIIDNDA